MDYGKFMMLNSVLLQRVQSRSFKLSPIRDRIICKPGPWY